ncbi:MAG: MarC family protein [archaeon]
MISVIVQLIILFFVIFDPPASFAVFVAGTRNMTVVEKRKTAVYAVLFAAILSLVFLLFGEQVLQLFTTNINEFKVAGGIILGILGVKMALGHTIVDTKSSDGEKRAVAAIIATPLLTGPAAITAIIISVHDFGMVLTGVAVAVVLIATALIFFTAEKINKLGGKTTIQMVSTILGLITLAWGVKFVMAGLQAIMAGVG